MNSIIIKRRIRVICRLLKRKRIDCLIATKPANVTYTTGFSGNDGWALITKRQVYLLTDSRYTEQAEAECPRCEVIQRDTGLSETTAELVKKLKSIHTIAVEKSASLAVFDSLKRHFKGRLKTAANIIESARIIKDNGEIAAIKAAAQIAAEALRKIRQHIKPGITENKLAGILDFQIRLLGARNNFDTIVAFGANASRPHHQPGSRKLKKNDTILIDFGVKYNGCCCDLTRCFAVGRMSPLYKKVYNTVREAQAAAIKTVKAGVEIRRVDEAARKVIADRGLPVYGHGTGHGVGLEVHEEPIISAKAKGKIKAGMVFTIEPGVYIPGKLGVRIEDDILVTRKGHIVLTG